jgi:outer membrane protein assembly factor BamB
MKSGVFVILLSFVLLQNGLSQVLSEWRGIGRTGVYTETGLLKKWPENGPTMLWSLKDIPTGNSSVSIANNTLYLTGIKDSMEILIAVNDKGVVQWQTSYGRAWNHSFPESRCTPTVEKDKIFVSSGLGDLACVSPIDGKIIWKLKASEKFEGVYGMWGIAESPLIVDHKLIFTPAGEKTTVVALNENTGETIWTSESIHDKPSYVSPLLIERNGEKEIIAVTEKFILGVDPDHGKIIWKFDYGAYSDRIGHYSIVTNTPLYDNGRLYMTTGYNHSSVMLNLNPDGSSVAIAWVDSTMDVHHGGVVKVGNFIYGSNWLNNGMGNWACLDWTTGKTMYETKWINKGSIITAEGLLYCYEEKTGNIALVKASPEAFQIISTFKIPLGKGPHWAHPVIHNGILYIRHGETLMAYDIKEK